MFDQQHGATIALDDRNLIGGREAIIIRDFISAEPELGADKMSPLGDVRPGVTIWIRDSDLARIDEGFHGQKAPIYGFWQLVLTNKLVSAVPGKMYAWYSAPGAGLWLHCDEDGFAVSGQIVAGRIIGEFEPEALDAAELVVLPALETLRLPPRAARKQSEIAVERLNTQRRRMILTLAACGAIGVGAMLVDESLVAQSKAQADEAVALEAQAAEAEAAANTARLMTYRQSDAIYRGPVRVIDHLIEINEKSTGLRIDEAKLMGPSIKAVMDSRADLPFARVTPRPDGKYNLELVPAQIGAGPAAAADGASS